MFMYNPPDKRLTSNKKVLSCFQWSRNTLSVAADLKMQMTSVEVSAPVEQKRAGFLAFNR
jgi:hypothetical protein